MESNIQMKGDFLVSRRQGFTLVELLVVISIIGVLVALLLPAVQAAREAARRAQCINNEKQIGLALQMYHGAKGHLPMAQDHGDPLLAGNRPGWGWSAFIMPYIEGTAAYDQIDFDKYIWEGNHPEIIATPVPFALCPSDQTEPVRAHLEGPASIPAQATSSYVVSSGPFNMAYSSSKGYPERMRGCFYLNTNVKFRQISDGLSKTIFLGENKYQEEVINPPLQRDWNGFWYGRHDIRRKPGASFFILSLARTAEVKMNAVGGGEGVLRKGFHSFHPGGVHFLFGDGSVQFLSETIEHKAASFWPPAELGESIDQMGAYQKLHGRDDGLVVGEI